MSSLKIALRTVAVVLLAIPIRAGAMDFLCSPSQRQAAHVTASSIGTSLVGNALNVFDGRRGSPITGADTLVYVNVRTCKFSSDPEYETWVFRRGASRSSGKWVSLAGALNRFDGRPMWIVGPKLPEGTNLLAHMQSARPEIRMVRLYFEESKRAAIEAGKLGGMQVTEHRVDWTSIKKGELVTLPDGRSVPVSADLLGPEVTLTLANTQRSSEPNGYSDDFYLANAENELLTKPLSCDRCKDFKGGETRTVRLLPDMQPPAAYAKPTPMFLVNTRTGLRLPVPPPK